MVRKEGVEPSRVTPYASETYVSANCTTSAKIRLALSIFYPYKSVKLKIAIRRFYWYNIIFKEWRNYVFRCI